MGIMNNCFVLGGERSLDFGLFISGTGTFNSPSRDIEKISVAGRNGDLIIDNGRFLNVSVVYPAYILKDFASKSEQLREWLLSDSGYRRLEDTYHPNEFRMARYDGNIEFDMWRLNKAGQCNLKFDCKPQRFLRIGEMTVEFISAGEIKNPTRFEAKPLIRVYGSGTLSIGSVSITIDGVSDYIDIDCETQQAYKGAQWLNDKITLSGYSFPTLVAGITAINFTGITKVEITPRWWRV